jgi:integrase
MKLEKITARGAEGLYREVTTKIIYFRQYRKGRGEIKRSTRTTVLEEAKKERDRLSKEDRKTVNSASATKSALEKYNAWIERKKNQGKSAATITSMKASGNFFGLFLGKMLPAELSAEWWDTEFIPKTKYVRFKSRRNEHGEYVNEPVLRKTQRKFFNDRKWMTAFLEQCLRDGAIKSVPLLVNPDPEREPGKVYADEEIEALLNFAPHEDLYLAILMGVTMGMRRGEIFGLKSDRVDVKKGIIRLRAEDTKIRKARAFAISPATREMILSRAKAGPWIFPSKDSMSVPLHKDGYTNAWKTLKERTGVEGRFHFLRHTFLTKAFRAPGANAALICHYAGLSLEVAQKVYLHFDDDDTIQVAGLVQYAV